MDENSTTFLRLESLFRTNLIAKNETTSNSVLIEILINLNDLLIKAKKNDKRITFNDDIIIDEKFKIYDITDLIKNFRDAACHIHSFRRKIDSNNVSFGKAFGKCNWGAINGVEIKSKYDDDIAIIMGTNILYIKRHIYRVYSELKKTFNYQENHFLNNY